MDYRDVNGKCIDRGGYIHIRAGDFYFVNDVGQRGLIFFTLMEKEFLKILI